MNYFNKNKTFISVGLYIISYIALFLLRGLYNKGSTYPATRNTIWICALVSLGIFAILILMVLYSVRKNGLGLGILKYLSTISAVLTLTLFYINIYKLDGVKLCILYLTMYIIFIVIKGIYPRENLLLYIISCAGILSIIWLDFKYSLITTIKTVPAYSIAFGVLFTLVFILVFFIYRNGGKIKGICLLPANAFYIGIFTFFAVYLVCLPVVVYFRSKGFIVAYSAIILNYLWVLVNDTLKIFTK